MAVRFVIGRAGTGKTHRCVSEIQEALVTSAVAGPPLILLVPEQATLQMEQAILAGAVRATSRARVLSFERLAHLVLDRSPVRQRTTLSAVARAMVLRSIVASERNHLQYYRRAERWPSFFVELGTTVSELLAEAIPPTELRPDEALIRQSPAQAAKLADLAHLYEAYIAWLGDTHLDPLQHLTLAGDALRSSELLQGARLWVDGFAGFSGQERQLLVTLVARAAECAITLLADPTAVADHAPETDLDDAAGFSRTLRTHAQLYHALVEHGVELAPPLMLDAPPPRFAHRADLAHLERFFDTLQPVPMKGDVPNVHVVAAADRRVEALYAAATIARLVHESDDLRYRDTAIIVRDLDDYHDLLAAALTDMRVPHFIDRRQPVAQNPVVEWVRNLLQLAAGDMPLETTRLLLKTGIAPFTELAADALENYLLAHGINGWTRWSGDDWTKPPRPSYSRELPAVMRHELRRVNHCRRTLAALLAPWIDPPDATRTCTQWAGLLTEAITRWRVPERIEAWARAAEAEGALQSAAEYRQSLDQVRQLVDDLATGLGPVSMTTADLAAVVEAGLSQLSLALVPPTLDQVLVGSVERSRHPSVKVVFVLGFGDGQFPAVPAESVILSDEDRLALRHRGTEVGVTRHQRVGEETLLAYIALTRASASLYLCYPASDEQGRPLRPSPYLERVRQALPSLACRKIDDPLSARTDWWIQTPRQLALALIHEFRQRPERKLDDAALRGHWNSLYTAACDDPATEKAMTAVRGALLFDNAASLNASTARALARQPYATSVSELEKQSCCPFQRFAAYALRLETRRQAPMQANDLGTLQHAILEDLLQGCIDAATPLAQLSETGLGEAVNASAERVGHDAHHAAWLNSARDRYHLDRSPHDLVPLLRDQQRLLAAGTLQPCAAEQKFGFSFDPKSLPPLVLEVSDGRTIHLRGIIDRIDLARHDGRHVAVVVDYKRTHDKRLKLPEVLHGLALQLIGYLLALRASGSALVGVPVEPAGALYLSLLRRYKSVLHPDDVAEDRANRYKPRGVLSSADLPALIGSGELGRWSTHLQIYLTKDGKLGNANSSDALAASDFEALLAYTQRKLTELATAILDGDIKVSPYRLGQRSPCGWCPMGSVCRFEYGDPTMRFLDSPKREALLTRIGGGPAS